jgi:hypothetical protein
MPVGAIAAIHARRETLKTWIVLGVLAALLVSCGGAPAVDAPTAAPAQPTAAIPTAAPTPTLAQVVSGLQTQLTADEVIVREMTLDSGALPTLNINFEANITKMPPAGKQAPSDLSAEIERSILIISKRVAAQLATGFAVDRVNLVLKLQDQTVGNTRISARDMLAWSKGTMSDKDYRASWAQTVNY